MYQCDECQDFIMECINLMENSYERRHEIAVTITNFMKMLAPFYICGLVFKWLFDVFTHLSGVNSPSCLKLQTAVCSISLILQSLKCVISLVTIIKRLRSLPQQGSMISSFTTQWFGVRISLYCEFVQVLD